MSTIRSTIYAAIAFTLGVPMFAKDAEFAPVVREVRKRSKQEVTWQKDVTAKETARAHARALLRKPLTPARAVHVAVLNNPGLQGTFEEIGLSYADLREARTIENPEVEFAAKFPDRGVTKPSYEWAIAQNFLSLLMAPLRTRVAKEQLAASQMRVADEVIDLVARTKAAYYEALARQQAIARLKVALESQRASLELTQKVHEAGNITDLQLWQEQAEYSQFRLEIATAEAEYRESREKLNRLMGAWGESTNWTFGWSELPEVPASDVPLRGLERLAVANRLDLAAARQSLKSAARSLGLEKAFRFIGTLDFGIEGENEPDGLNLTGPSVRFELPIFNQGQARIARGEAQFRRAAAQFEQLAIEIRSNVRELRDRLISRRDIARFYVNELVPVRLQITALTLVHYNAMLVGPLEAFRARRADLEAEQKMIEATRDYWVTRVELERAVGGSIEVETKQISTTPDVGHKTTKTIERRKP